VQLSTEVRQLIQTSMTAAEEQLIREREEERRTVAANLSARGLSNSGIYVNSIFEVTEHWIKKRIDSRLGVYLETLNSLGIKIDLLLEAEITKDLEAVANANYQYHSQPNMNAPNQQAFTIDYARRMKVASTSALLQAKNKLRLERLKSSVPQPASQPPTPVPATVTHNYIVSGPNPRVNVGSTDNSTNVVQYNVPEMLDNIIRLSQEHGTPEMQQAANDVKAAYPDKKITATKIAAWISLAGQSAHLMHQALPYLMDVYGWLVKTL